MAAEPPPIEVGDEREVCAFYGLAMYMAQVMEHSLLNLACGLYLAREKAITRQLFDSTFEALDRKTLGQLLSAARTIEPFPSKAEEALASALERRNYLAHRFFREKAKDFMNAAGRMRMIAELRASIVLFSDTDELATPLYMKVWKVFGVDDAWIKRELAAIAKESADA